MSDLTEFAEILKQLDKDADALQSAMTNSALLKKFAFNLITLSKFITIFNEDYEVTKASLDKDIRLKVMELIEKDLVKYKNQAEAIAENERSQELQDLRHTKTMLEKAKILYNSYDRLFSVAHTEFKYLAKDMAVQNMHEQYAQRGSLPTEQQP